jgi:hypothetical protein
MKSSNKDTVSESFTDMHSGLQQAQRASVLSFQKVELYA